MALVWTQLQQVVLTAILRQENWKLDVLFVREGMQLLDPIRKLSAKVIALPNLSYSARAIGRFRRAGSDLIIPALGNLEAYRCLTWTLENPLARFVFTRSACTSIALFEDGTGSYVNRGRFGSRYGLKYVLTKALINMGLPRIHGLRTADKESEAEFYSLFPMALQGGTHARELRVDDYRQALLDANAAAGHQLELPPGGTLYLPSYFMDGDGLTRAEEVDLHADALRRYMECGKKAAPSVVLWKPHPRADLDLERKLVESVGKRLQIAIRILPADAIVEQILIANEKIDLDVVSMASSSIYTLCALGNPRHRLVCVDSPGLRKRFPMTLDLHDFYRKIGIRIID